MTTDGSCKAQSQVLNCNIVKQSGDDYICMECKTGFIFLNGKCEKGTLSNCIEWDFTIDSKSEVCKKCNVGYVAINGKC